MIRAKKPLFLFILTSLLLFSLSTLLAAEESGPVVAENGAVAPSLPSFQEFPNALGMSINSTTGWGLHWLYWKDNLGLSVTAGGSYLPEGATTNFLSPQNWVDYGISVQGLLRVYGIDFSKWLGGQLYVTALLGHQGKGAMIYSYDPVTSVSTNVRGPYVPMLNLGLGIGIELIWFKHFSIPLEIMYVGQYPFKLEPAVSLGLRYRF
jgi:hypothetical protein